MSPPHKLHLKNGKVLILDDGLLFHTDPDGINDHIQKASELPIPTEENQQESPIHGPEKQNEEGWMPITVAPEEGHAGWFSNYPHVGPGNKILSEAKNPIDAVARQHDIDYSRAKSFDDVQEADRQFIEDMMNVKAESLYESSIKHGSKLAIQAKSTLEKLAGNIVYPRLGKYFN
uniref:Structural protein VP1 n=1 Tax=Chaerephon bat parvovirus TaxID=3141915 RepID=A0AAU7DZN4_9VIRU